MANISKLQLSGVTYNIVDTTSGYATKTELTNAITGATEIINGELEKKFGYATYNEANKHIEFKASETGSVLAYVDATDFIKDGMLESAEITDGTGDNVGKKVLKLTFNTDAGKDAIEVPIGDLFNADNYYTKNEADGKFGTKTEQESLRSDLEDALGEIASLESDMQGKQDKLDGAYLYEVNDNNNALNFNQKNFDGTNVKVNTFKFKKINGTSVLGDGNITLPTKDDIEGKQDQLSGSYLYEMFGENNIIEARSQYFNGEYGPDFKVKFAKINGQNIVLGLATTPDVNLELATKEEVDNLDEIKADKSDTYTKAEVDKKVADSGTFDATQYYNKTEVNGLLAQKNQVISVEGDTLIIS